MIHLVSVTVPVVNAPLAAGVVAGALSVSAHLDGAQVGDAVLLNGTFVAQFSLDDGKYTFVAQALDSNGGALGDAVSTDFEVAEVVSNAQFSQPVGPLSVSMV